MRPTHQLYIPEPGSHRHLMTWNTHADTHTHMPRRSWWWDALLRFTLQSNWYSFSLRPCYLLLHLFSSLQARLRLCDFWRSLISLPLSIPPSWAFDRGVEIKKEAKPSDLRGITSDTLLSACIWKQVHMLLSLAICLVRSQGRVHRLSCLSQCLTCQV